MIRKLLNFLGIVELKIQSLVESMVYTQQETMREMNDYI